MAWQNVPNPFAAPPVGVPNPSVAAVLGLIPGVGAMYNGQFFKGLIHVVIFAVLINITEHYGIFGIFIGAWVLYQSFEAFHTAKARRDGQPLPDPLGLNEVGSWLNLGTRPVNPPQPGAAPYSPNPGQPNPGPTAGAYQPPYTGQYQAPYQQAQYQQVPYTPVAGFAEPPVPPVPPVPPLSWRRKEPIGAIVLIGLGLLFLLGQMDVFNGRLFEYTWPLLLIGIGVWLVIRRMGDTQGGSR
jgi:TM2 domain-containing membrane protein YozV